MRAIALSAAAVLILVGAYLALGGASYAPAKAADPCVPRDWRNPQDFEAVGEQIVLSALDGAACELHVSREEMVLALASKESRDRFAREHGISSQRLEQLARLGLLRAIDDAEQAHAINSLLADLLREVSTRIPVDQLLDLLEQLPTL